MTDNRVPAGVPTGGQFAASAKNESGVALASANLHPEVLAAIAQAKETGKPVRIEELSSDGFDPGENSSMCGDYSIGNEPSNRQTWATGNDDEPFISVTATYYVTARTEDGHSDLDYDDWQDAVKAREEWQAQIDRGYTEGNAPDYVPAVKYAWNEQTEWIAHRDLEDVGGTEVRSDYQYGDGSALFYDSLESAQQVATNNAIREDWDQYYPQNWK